MTKLFILHGWTYQTATWDAVRRLLDERGIDYEFLKIPGLTDGTNPTWTLEDYVAWLTERTAAYDKVILLGHSNGGRISLAYAAKYPEKVARLILEDSAGIQPRGFRLLKKNFFKKLSLTGRVFPHSELARKLFYKFIRENDYGKATPEMKKTLSNLAAENLALILDKIKAPTLIIWGGLDKTTPLQNGKLMHAGILGSRMVVIPDARHSPHKTHPELIANLIEAEIKAL